MPQQPKRPHILIFNPDSWRGDALGHMGDPAAVTPNLDRLAREEAVSFRNAFSQNPLCTPSRCSFMSGWYPHVRGHRTMRYMMRPGEPVLLKALKDAGYYVFWAGPKNDLVPAQDGFDAYCDEKPTGFWNGPKRFSYDLSLRGSPQGDNYYSRYLGQLQEDPSIPLETCEDYDWYETYNTLRFLKRAPKDRPVCMFVPTGFPHPPYAVEEPWFSMVDPNRLPPRTPHQACEGPKPIVHEELRRRMRLDTPGWTEERWAQLRAVYYGMCARSDHMFGMVLDALREAGMYDDTAIFFFSDHGDFTGDYSLVEKTSNTFEDCMVRVPFLIKPPSWAPAQPRVSDALVELVDFPATVEDLCGLTPEHDHFGRSLLPVIAGETDAHREAVFSEGGRPTWERHSRNKQVRLRPQSLYYPSASTQTEVPEAGGKAVMYRDHKHKYVYRLYEDDELYDLEADPQETKNRIHDPSLADLAGQLRTRILEWMVATADVVPHDQDDRVRRDPKRDQA